MFLITVCLSGILHKNWFFCIPWVREGKETRQIRSNLRTQQMKDEIRFRILQGWRKGSCWAPWCASWWSSWLKVLIDKQGDLTSILHITLKKGIWRADDCPRSAVRSGEFRPGIQRSWVLAGPHPLKGLQGTHLLTCLSLTASPENDDGRLSIGSL